MDLNADLGESFGTWTMGDDAAMFPLVTSASVACGMHAGDPVTMLDTLPGSLRARRQGRRPPRLPGSGRLRPPGSLDMTFDDLFGAVLYQLGALDGVAHAVGASVDYVEAARGALRPHGARRRAGLRRGRRHPGLRSRTACPGLPRLGPAWESPGTPDIRSSPKPSPTAPTCRTAPWCRARGRGRAARRRTRSPSGPSGSPRRAKCEPWTAPCSGSAGFPVPPWRHPRLHRDGRRRPCGPGGRRRGAGELRLSPAVTAADSWPRPAASRRPGAPP